MEGLDINYCLKLAEKLTGTSKENLSWEPVYITHTDVSSNGGWPITNRYVIPPENRTLFIGELVLHLSTANMVNPNAHITYSITNNLVPGGTAINIMEKLLKDQSVPVINLRNICFQRIYAETDGIRRTTFFMGIKITY